MTPGRAASCSGKDLILNPSRCTPSNLRGVIPEIEIWRVANQMLKRYGDTAQAESARRANELAAVDDLAGVAVWRRIIDAVDQLANTIPPGPVR